MATDAIASSVQQAGVFGDDPLEGIGAQLLGNAQSLSRLSARDVRLQFGRDLDRARSLPRQAGIGSQGRGAVRPVSPFPFQSVRAVFPHTAYRWSS